MAVTIHPLPPRVLTTNAPKQFTFPFCYEPHPLCVAAANEVRRYISQRKEWRDELQKGKMFGVLIVDPSKSPLKGETSYSVSSPFKGELERVSLSFLAAFSGTLDGKTQHEYFVPPVFDPMSPGCYFQEEEAAISAINRRIAHLESSFSPRPLCSEARQSVMLSGKTPPPRGRMEGGFCLLGRANTRRQSIADCGKLGSSVCLMTKRSCESNRQRLPSCSKKDMSAASPCSSGCSASSPSSMHEARRSRYWTSSLQPFRHLGQGSVAHHDCCKRHIKRACNRFVWPSSGWELRQQTRSDSTDITIPLAEASAFPSSRTCSRGSM